MSQSLSEELEKTDPYDSAGYWAEPLGAARRRLESGLDGVIRCTHNKGDPEGGRRYRGALGPSSDMGTARSDSWD
jgi:hypothetical protein